MALVMMGQSLKVCITVLLASEPPEVKMISRGVASIRFATWVRAVSRRCLAVEPKVWSEEGLPSSPFEDSFWSLARCVAIWGRSGRVAEESK